MKTAAIIGFGRFGELLAEVLAADFDFSIIESDPVRREAAQDKSIRIVELNNLAEFDFVFLCVPISNFESTIRKIAPHLSSRQVVVDVCSVKVFPARVMQKYLTSAQIIATHPLFGPDSAKLGLEGLKTAYIPLRCEGDNANHLRLAWQRIGVEIVDTTPEEHDQESVYSQAFTYSIARIILNMELPEITFDTKSYQSITRVADLSANDTDQLFNDMMHYNPYFPKMLAQLKGSWEGTLATLESIGEESQPDVFADAGQLDK